MRTPAPRRSADLEYAEPAVRISQTPIARDQEASPFSGILLRLCDSTSALGAALVDAEGETVDYAGRVDTFDLRVAAAEWRLVLALIDSSPVPAWHRTHELVVRARTCSFAVWALTEGYALVLVLARHTLRVSRRALCAASDELQVEAGLSRLHTPDAFRWSRVQVRTSRTDALRPEAIWYAEDWRELSIVGRLTRELDRHEVGYLARLASGAEVLLVREPLDKWFVATPM